MPEPAAGTDHEHGREHGAGHAAPVSLNRAAFSATAHCLTGCAIGEVLGLVIATALGWANAPSIVLAVALAFRYDAPSDSSSPRTPRPSP
jgi:hypothetical protein